MNEIYEDLLLVDLNNDEVLDDLDFVPDQDSVLDYVYDYNYDESIEDVLYEVQTDGDDLSVIQDEFLCYVKQEEYKMFGESFVENFFCRYQCPIEDIINKSRTELWLENMIYGIQFQAYLCHNLGISLPLAPLRHRKIQSRKNNKKERHNDLILEHFIKLCEHYPRSSNSTKRLAPRDQISLLVFILDILNHPYFQHCVRWKERTSLTFEIIKPKAVAYFWMVVKDNEMCSFENFTRAIRFKRNAGVFKHINHKKRRVYQFHPKALREYKLKRTSNKLSLTLIKILG